MNMRPAAVFKVMCLALAACSSIACAAAFDASTPAGAVLASNRFGFDLYGRIKTDDKNLICSPVSAAVALNMASGGARGATQAEMLRALHVDPARSADSHASFGKLLSALNRGGGSSDGVILTVADRLWGQKDLAFNPEFLALLRDRYHAPLEPVDFAGAPGAALAAINSWASTQTHGRIPEILGSDAVGPSTRLILTNAVYFLGNWVKPFHPDTTREGDFTGVKGPVKVKIMHQKETFAHAREGDAQIVELPYKGNLSMLVVLPDAAAGLPAVEKRMGDKYDAWVAALRPKEVELELPRWTFTSDLSLIKPLGQLGMRRAFQGDADFSGIAAGGGLAINEVIQKAFIEVNETGTEAAAVTALGMYSLSLGPPPPQPVIFHADHPFLYVIRDTTTGAILFIGRVVDGRS